VNGSGGREAGAYAGAVRPVLPVTGAWGPGDPPGRRQFAPLGVDRPFVLEGGGVLRNAQLAYETWGELSPAADNAILVCHALTGDSHAAGDLGHGHPTPGWWDEVIGPGKAIDTDRWFVVCMNVPGGCQGSTGPASPHPDDGKPYGSRFPVVTIRDMVRAEAAVAKHVGIEQWLAVVGGSMGGMQVLEWGVMFPERVRGLVPIATTFAASAQQIAWWSTGRRIIHMDPRWQGGDYYDADAGDGPSDGLAVARMVSQITFRSETLFSDRFGREVVEPIEGYELWQRFQVERYLQYHGDKLARRFDANSYLLLTKAMDLHDIGRGRGGMDIAVRRITAPTFAMGVSSDFLYPTYQQELIAGALLGNGVDVRYLEIDSPHGHDAFLLEHDQVGGPLHDFLIEIEKSA
jgi:homoserine O-acetyltransferase